MIGLIAWKLMDDSREVCHEVKVKNDSSQLD